jgi:preprotein translocase subunit SecE
MVKKLVKFLKEVNLEMKKVSWSTKNELISATIVTFVFIAILALYIGIIDFILSRLITLIIR